MTISKSGFAHLHVHSDHSLLDGVSKIWNNVKLAAEDGQTAVALTDHGDLSGIIKLFTACKFFGIKPVPGIEAYLVDDYDTSNVRYHQILLAYNNTGYRNLMKIYEESTKHHYGKYDVISMEDIAPYTEGIMATSSCLSGKVLSLMLKSPNGNEIISEEGEVLDDDALESGYSSALAFVREQQEMFGKDNYFIEVQDHGIPKQVATNPHLVRLSEESGAPLIAAQDSHYEHPGQSEVHSVKLAMSTGGRIDDPIVFRFDGDRSHHFTTADEMREVFPDDVYPGAINNTQMIADRVEEINVIEIDTKNYRIPKFETPDGSDETEYFERVVWAGVSEFYGDDPGKEIIDQVQYQIDVTEKMGYVGYTLIVAEEIIKFCNDNGIRLGPGRGSAAGSAINYATKITKLDPILFNLIFERYLNPNRLSMPDIDIDVDPRYRHSVVRNLEDIHGKGNVSSIVTLGTYKAKSAAKKVVRAFGFSAKTAQEISDLIPASADLSQVVFDELKKDASDKETAAWEEASGLRTYIEEHPTMMSDGFIRKEVDANGMKQTVEYEGSECDLSHMLHIASQMQGLLAGFGVHASGYLVSPDPISSYMPLSWENYEKDGFPRAMLEFPDAESIGAMKFDILGLTSLTLIDRTLELVRETTGKDIDIDSIPLDDDLVYKYISEGNTYGMFQVEGEKISELVERLAPETIEDMSSIVALYRPGPLGLKMHIKFADVKNGRARPDPIHPGMMDLFPETYGIVVYQEQLIDLVRHYAGFSAARGDELRRATGKKDIKKMESLYTELHDGMIENGYTEKLVKDFWDMILPFSDYSFNKAHSICYGYISYQTAWLKYHHPTEFFAASLDLCKKERRARFVREIRTNKIPLFPPQVLISTDQVNVKDGGIYLSLSQVSGCGDAATSAILSAREQAQFDDIVDFTMRSGVGRNIIGSLASVGAFVEMHGCRKAINDNLDEIVSLGKQKASLVTQNEEGGLFSSAISTDVGLPDFSDKEYTLEEITDLEMSLLEYSISTDARQVLADRLDRIISSGYASRGSEIISSDFIEAGNSRDMRSVVGYATDVSREKRKGAHLYTFTLSDGRDVHQNISYWAGEKFDFPPGSVVSMKLSIGTEEIEGETDPDTGEEMEPRIITRAKVKRGSLRIVGDGDEIDPPEAEEAPRERSQNRGRRNVGRSSERGAQRRTGDSEERKRHESTLTEENRNEVKPGVRGRLRVRDVAEKATTPKTVKTVASVKAESAVTISVPNGKFLPSVLETLSHVKDGKRKVMISLPDGKVKSFSRRLSITERQCSVIARKIGGEATFKNSASR